MNTPNVTGSWQEQKAKLKKKFALLTDNDLLFEKGRKDEMFVKIQIILGKTEEEMRKIMAAL
ncbi:MAG: general stress protein CsbD [Bacteroidetes bacterium]|nr:general stress protein CsbD [Bacteroidota bacterium]MBU1719489.1 general stress protein CsbD [Bacteroidota bacterium]